jgi:hypothetical protein
VVSQTLLGCGGAKIAMDVGLVFFCHVTTFLMADETLQQNIGFWMRFTMDFTKRSG